MTEEKKQPDPAQPDTGDLAALREVVADFDDLEYFAEDFGVFYKIAPVDALAERLRTILAALSKSNAPGAA